MTPTDNLEPITEEELNEFQKLQTQIVTQKLLDGELLSAIKQLTVDYFPRLLKGYGEVKEGWDNSISMNNGAAKKICELKAQLAEKERVIQELETQLISRAEKISLLEIRKPCPSCRYKDFVLMKGLPEVPK
jgi:hypothetical protein